MKVSLLTGGGDRPYALGLLSCLLNKDIDVDFIGSDELFDQSIMRHPRIVFYNLRGNQSPNVTFFEKLARVLKYYMKLIVYAYKTDSCLFHIIWLNKFIYFDRTILNIYFKMLGKKLVYTAHNIDQKERDGESNAFNKFTLRFMYNIMDHIFVHTYKMKQQLVNQFNVNKDNITVIPFGINNTVPLTNITKSQAKEKLGLFNAEKVILFFGNIAPYKGLEYLVMAMPILLNRIGQVKLIVAGRIKDCESYWRQIQSLIEKHNLENSIIQKTVFIPDADVEIYYKSADVVILPYIHIFQSGVLSLSYNFGVPVIATDVGSLKEDIVDGKTGFLCKSKNPKDLAEKIVKYYDSDLYNNLENNRYNIINFAKDKYSWDKVSRNTVSVYEKITH